MRNCYVQTVGNESTLGIRYYPDGIPNQPGAILVIEDNTVRAIAGGNGALFLDSHPLEMVHDVVVRRNLLSGGGYTVYGGSNATNSSSNVKFYDNVWGIDLYPSGGYWGAVAYYRKGPGNLWSNNTFPNGTFVSPGDEMNRTLLSTCLDASGCSAGAFVVTQGVLQTFGMSIIKGCR